MSWKLESKVRTKNNTIKMALITRDYIAPNYIQELPIGSMFYLPGKDQTNWSVLEKNTFTLWNEQTKYYPVYYQGSDRIKIKLDQMDKINFNGEPIVEIFTESSSRIVRN
jgi:hypothetical protein